MSPVADELDTRFLLDEISPGLGPAYGAANVVTRLANAGVAYGVPESRGDGGNPHKHPVKRARTTLTYIAVAGFATTPQVLPELSPADRDPFLRYRDEQLDNLEFGQRTKDFRVGIARLDFPARAGPGLARRLEPVHGHTVV